MYYIDLDFVADNGAHAVELSNAMGADHTEILIEEGPGGGFPYIRAWFYEQPMVRAYLEAYCGDNSDTATDDYMELVQEGELNV